MGELLQEKIEFYTLDFYKTGRETYKTGRIRHVS